MHRPEQYTNKPFPAMPVTRHLTIEHLPYCAWREGRKSASDEYHRSHFHLVSVLWKSPDVFLFAFSWVSGKPQKNSAAHADDGYRGDIPETAPEPTQCGTPDIPVSTAQCGHRTAGSGLEHRYYLSPAIRWFCLSGSVYRLVQPLRAVLRSVNHLGSPVLCSSPQIGSGIRQCGNKQHRPGVPVYLQGIHRSSRDVRDENQYGRQRASSGQCVHRTTLAYRQIRGHLSQRLPGAKGCSYRITVLFPVLQLPAASSGTQRQITSTGLCRKVIRVAQQASGERMGGHIPPIPPLNTCYIIKKKFTETPLATSLFATLSLHIFCLTKWVHLIL
jgi:hypothetical protein